MKSTATPSGIIDPFQVTDEQSDIASAAYHALHIDGLSRKLTDSQKERQDILQEIRSTTASRYWASRGNFRPHWSEVSARAIAQLQQLGFRDNADVQRYLDSGELPDVSG